jgi:hypothetical protein
MRFVSLHPSFGGGDYRPSADPYPGALWISNDTLTLRIIIAALGFLLIGRLLFDYFFRARRLLEHPNPRVPRLNRLRVYSVVIAFGTIALAPIGYNFGLPILGALILFGIGIVAGIVYLVCTFWVISITGHL